MTPDQLGALYYILVGALLFFGACIYGLVRCRQEEARQKARNRSTGEVPSPEPKAHKTSAADNAALATLAEPKYGPGLIQELYGRRLFSHYPRGFIDEMRDLKLKVAPDDYESKHDDQLDAIRYAMGPQRKYVPNPDCKHLYAVLYQNSRDLGHCPDCGVDVPWPKVRRYHTDYNIKEDSFTKIDEKVEAKIDVKIVVKGIAGVKDALAKLGVTMEEAADALGRAARANRPQPFDEKVKSILSDENHAGLIPLRDPDPEPVTCCEVDPSGFYLCTRPENHTGHHIATDTEGNELARWRDSALLIIDDPVRKQTDEQRAAILKASNRIRKQARERGKRVAYNTYSEDHDDEPDPPPLDDELLNSVFELDAIDDDAGERDDE